MNLGERREKFHQSIRKKKNDSFFAKMREQYSFVANPKQFKLNTVKQLIEKL